MPIAIESLPEAATPKMSAAPIAILVAPLALIGVPGTICAAFVPIEMLAAPPAVTPIPQATLPAAAVDVPPFWGSAPVALPPQTNCASAGAMADVYVAAMIAAKAKYRIAEIGIAVPAIDRTKSCPRGNLAKAKHANI